jgi:hypothetical protein
VQEQLRQLTLDTLARSNIKTSDLLTELAEIAYLDPAESFDTPQGQRTALKTMTEMPSARTRAVASVRSGDRQPGPAIGCRGDHRHQIVEQGGRLEPFDEAQRLPRFLRHGSTAARIACRRAGTGVTAQRLVPYFRISPSGRPSRRWCRKRRGRGV